jgi:hypothetical protein
MDGLQRHTQQFADYRRISRVDIIQIAQFNLNNKRKFIIYKKATKIIPGNINSRFKKGGVTAALDKLVARESINRRLDLISNIHEFSFDLKVNR